MDEKFDDGMARVSLKTGRQPEKKIGHVTSTGKNMIYEDMESLHNGSGEICDFLSVKNKASVKSQAALPRNTSLARYPG